MAKDHRHESGTGHSVHSHRGSGHGHAHEHVHPAGHVHGVARRRVLATGLAAAALTIGTSRSDIAHAQALIADLGERARRFVGLLDPLQRRAALYAYDAPARLDWHYVPRSRPGLAFRGMNAEQRATAE